MTDKPNTDRPRRILHIGKYFPPHYGGMETILRDQMNMQTRDEGLQVAAVVHSSERRLTEKVEIQPLGYRVRFAARWLTAIFAPIAPFFWLSIIREIRELNPDEIKVHMPNLSAFWLLLLPSALSRKWVILWHSDVLPSRHHIGLQCFYWLYKPFEWLLLQRADQVIATSPPYLESSKPLMEFRHKCIIEPLRLDKNRIPERFRSGTKPKRHPSEGVRVLCVGRLTYYKGFSTVIEAMTKIPSGKLRIVGEGELRHSLQGLIGSLGLAKRVTLLGQIEDDALWQQYTWCDIHCLPSCERTEAFGLSVTEAAIFNRPNVVSKLSDSGLVWNAQHTGVPFATATPGDPDDFAAKIVEVFKSCVSNEERGDANR